MIAANFFDHVYISIYSFMISFNLKRISSLSAAFILFLSVSLMAQVKQQELVESASLTLDAAIKVAVANNPEINRAILSVQDADELVRIAYGEVYPNISSSLNYTRNFEVPVSFLPGEILGRDPDKFYPVAFGTDNNWQGGFTVTQNIFQGEVFVGLSTSTIFKTVQQENLRATTQQIITQTRAVYYQVLVAKEQLRLQESQIRRLEENLRENKSRRDAGLVDDYNVLQLEVQLSNQRPQLIEAEYAVDEAYRELKKVLGIPLEIDLEVQGNLNAFDIIAMESSTPENEHIKKIDQMNPYSYEKNTGIWAKVLNDRGDMRILDASLNLNEKEIQAIKSRFLPTVNATYNLQWTAAEPGKPSFFENNARFQTLGINVSLPIFEGFQRMANVQRAKIARKDIEEQIRGARLSAQSEIESAAEDLNKAFETAEARKQALNQAEEGYQRALSRLENGIGSQIEVTEAEVQVRQAEVNYAVMVFEYLNAKAQYDLATGQVPYVDTEILERN